MMEFLHHHDVLGRIITVALILVTLCGWEAWVLKLRARRMRCRPCKGRGWIGDQHLTNADTGEIVRTFRIRCLTCNGTGRHSWPNS